MLNNTALHKMKNSVVVIFFKILYIITPLVDLDLRHILFMDAYGKERIDFI